MKPDHKHSAVNTNEWYLSVLTHSLLVAKRTIDYTSVHETHAGELRGSSMFRLDAAD